MNRLLFSFSFSFLKKKIKMADSKTSTFKIRLQTAVKCLFLAEFEIPRDSKRPNMSFFIARDPQNCPSSDKKLFWEINSLYRAVGSIIDCTSCTCKASTKWKCSKVVYSIWVGQSEFSKDWSDCYWGLEVADIQIL